MSAEVNDEDTEVVQVPVPMDRETRRRLAVFANAFKETPTDAAGILLKDLLADVDFWEAAGLKFELAQRLN